MEIKDRLQIGFCVLFLVGVAVFILAQPTTQTIQISENTSIPEKFIPAGIMLFLAFLITFSGVIVRGLVKRDLKDLREGRIWTPLGYKNLK